MPDSDSWIKLSYFCLGVTVLLFLFLSVSLSLNPSAEPRREKDEERKVLCSVTLIAEPGLYEGLLKKPCVLTVYPAALINLSHSPSRTSICDVLYQNSVTFSCILHYGYTKNSIIWAVFFFLISAKNPYKHWWSLCKTSRSSVLNLTWKITHEHCDPLARVR